MFANIAHDLKNPISSVLGFARALESGTVKAEEQALILHTICEKSLQIDEMIQKMNIANNVGICYTMPRQEMRLVTPSQHPLSVVGLGSDNIQIVS